MFILANRNTFVSVIKGKVTPLQARLWPRGLGGGGRFIALLFQDLGARKG
jgi:hypothetical protein